MQRALDSERRLRAALDDPTRAQAELLSSVLAAHAQTEFGRAHGFARITDLEQFRRQVGVSGYASFGDAIDRTMTGGRDLLIAGDPIFFARTSGTTGRPKHVPFSRQVPDEYWPFVGAVVGAIERQAPGVVDRGMAILGQYREDQTADGVPIGSASGFVRNQLRGVPHFDALPMAITEEARHDLRYYATLLVALAQPLRMLHAINPSTLLGLFREAERLADPLAHDLAHGTCSGGPDGVGALIARSGFRLAPRPDVARRLRDVLATEGAFLPEAVWPELAMFATWQGGNCRHYLDQLARLCPRVQLRATTSGSSEAALLVPLEPDWTGGVPAMLSTVFEFFASDEDPQTTGPLAMGELEAGRGYRLCVTNHRGMYRLLMDDVFVVEGWHGTVPVLRFSSRLATSSVTGEKITEQHVTDAVARAQQATGVAIQEYQVAAQLQTVPRYVLVLEQPTGQAAAPSELREFLAAFEAGLREVNTEYRAKRDSGRLGSPVLRRIARGELARQARLARTGRSDAQSKIARLRVDGVRELALQFDDDGELSLD